MTHWQLGRREEARAMLIKGEILAPSIIPERGILKFGASWLAWLIARIGLDEAASLIQSQPPEKVVTKP